MNVLKFMYVYLQVPGSKKACECGHVLTETKMIGRKRYSGLYYVSHLLLSQHALYDISL